MPRFLQFAFALALAAMWATAQSAPALSSTSGYLPPDSGQCSGAQNAGSTYLQLGDPSNGSVGQYICMQVGPASSGGGAWGWVPLATLPASATTGQINVQAMGAKGNGVTNDAASIQAACNLAAAIEASAYFPPGTYLVKTALSVRCNVTMDASATIKAGASMAQVVTIAPATVLSNASWTGGTVDANNLANDAILIDNIHHYAIDSVTATNALVNNFHLGTGSNAYSAYEVIGTNLHSLRTSGSLVLNSAGLYVDTNSTDNNIAHSVFVGADYGMHVKTGGNFFSDIHVWSPTSAGAMRYAFYDEGLGNIWKGCKADTPTLYGLYTTSTNTIILGCHFYNGVFGGLDNIAIGIYFAATGSGPFATLVGNIFRGEDSSHRWAKDVDGAVFPAGLSVFGSQETNVATQKAQNQISTQSIAFWSGTTHIIQQNGSGFAFGKDLCYFWDAQSNLDSGSFDTSLCRLAANQLGLGNGTAGDFSGTLKLSGVLATAGSCTGQAFYLKSDGTCVSNPIQVIASTAGNNVVALSTTTYLRPLGTNTTENQTFSTLLQGGTLKNLCISLLTTQNVGGTMVFSVVVNNATPTAITLTFANADGAVTKCDTTHTVAVNATDQVSIQAVNNYSGGNSAGIGAYSIGEY